MVRNIVFIGVVCLLFGCKERGLVLNEREFIPLSGIWTTELGEVSLPGSIDENRLAPRNNDTLNTGRLTRLYPYEGKLVYTREIEIPPSSEWKEWRLIMERTKPSIVWIDGEQVGENSLILTPQIYSLGRLKAGKHSLSIEIDNSSYVVPSGIHGSHAWTDATQTNWNGIIGKFGLESNEGILIENLQVFPDIQSNKLRVKAAIQSLESGKAVLNLEGATWNTTERGLISRQKVELQLNEGIQTYEFEFSTGDYPLLWSEFNPALYKLHFELTLGDRRDVYTTDIGLRDFSTKGTQFQINEKRTFLRGKHDACIFPLTGYPPMEKEEWLRQMRISKEYGFNHYRFHSWTPPQAAFDAANELGIYMQAELPYWGEMNRQNDGLNDFLIREGRHLLNSYGNNPSFVMMALGNELGGDVDFMREITEDFRTSDNRRLYAFGANNALGTAGQQPGEDFLVTCRVGGEVGSSDYSHHTRTTFSFADAVNGGYLNGTYPSTEITFEKAVANSTVPVISHENGQFQVYPDYNEIEKYTGVLYPYNMEVFRRRLQERGLGEQANDFHRATVRFAELCYKADIEMCLRTPGFGGFQLLDLQDYPGQGSAYVGLLDAFMDAKAGVTPGKFRNFCNEIVPLALMPRYSWSNNEDFTARFGIFNFSGQPLKGVKCSWALQNVESGELLAESVFEANVAQGEMIEVEDIDASLRSVSQPARLILSLRVGEYTNQYDIWVYPVAGETNYPEIEETSSLSITLELLKQGKIVLFTPDHQTVEYHSVGGLFTPDYWNYAMFKSISENLNRDVSPGTLSILTDPEHPLFSNFPTDMHSNWQWWVITKNARPFILDSMPRDYKPIVQVIDNIERGHKLGILFEMRVGEGKLLVNMCDLQAIEEKPEGRQYRRAILEYISSSSFDPVETFTPKEIITLFTTTAEQEKIVGVKNITTYQ